MSDAPQELGFARNGGPTELRQLTAARVALGRSGTSVCTRDHLAFQLDHAAARDAVQMQMQASLFAETLRQRDWSVLNLQSSVVSNVPKVDRRRYLQRPDLGRKLSPESAEAIRSATVALTVPPDVVLVIADGLSVLAIERNVLPLLDILQPMLVSHRWGYGPICIVRDARVAIGDEIGEVLGAALAVVLIGERPGLSAPDSLGLYLTWGPRVGRTDAERNCISNIRLGGLSHLEAAERLILQMDTARALQRSGVELQRGADEAPALL